jgi:hypothetical protein
MAGTARAGEAANQQKLLPFDLGDVARAFERHSLSQFVRPEADPDTGQPASSHSGEDNA